MVYKRRLSVSNAKDCGRDPPADKTRQDSGRTSYIRS